MIKYGPLKYLNNNNINSKNKFKNIKSKIDNIKNIENDKKIYNKDSLNLNKMKIRNNIQDSQSFKQNNNTIDYIINNIKNNQHLLEKIISLQKWWKKLFKIIKIQKYLRGFLYRIKLLKLLELKEKIVYGIIYLLKGIKKIIFKNISKSIKNKLFQKLKYYFNKWKNLIYVKIILQKLKKYNIKKKEKNKKIMKMITESETKRKILKKIGKKRLSHEKMNTLESNSKKLRLTPNRKFFENLSLSSKKYGYNTSRFKTKKNINNLCITKMDKKETKIDSDNNLTNINSNKSLNHQTSNKKTYNFNKISSNTIKDKNPSQIKNYNYIFSNKNNSKNKTKINKKNKIEKRNNTIERSRNKNFEIFDYNLNNYESYNMDSKKNKLDININKISKLEYMSSRENRFYNPKIIYSLNKNGNKKTNIKIEKLDLSQNKSDKKNNKKDKNKIYSRAKSSEKRSKKKFNYFVHDINNIYKISNDDSCLNRTYINEINDDSLNRTKKENNLILYRDYKSKNIVKNKTKLSKEENDKDNKNNILQNSLKVTTRFKSMMTMICFKLWRMKYIKKKILNKLRSISFLNHIIKSNYIKNNGNSFISYLVNNQKYKILHDNFTIYRNIIFTKIILQKLKDIKMLENNNKNSDNNYDINDDENKKQNIIEISPYNSKIENKIKNNYIKNEINKKLQKLLIIRQKIIEYFSKKKCFLKWNLLTYQYEPNLKTRIRNIKEFYNNYKNDNKSNNNENISINSSYLKKKLLNFSFKEDNNKLYNKKIVNYNNNNINLNKEDYFNNIPSQINNFRNTNNYTNYNDYNILQKNYIYPNLKTSPQYDEPKKINININLITKSPLPNGIYQKKKINNYKNSNFNNSFVFREKNNPNSEYNKIKNNNNCFMNKSMILGTRKNNINDNIYYPKHINHNFVEKEFENKLTKITDNEFNNKDNSNKEFKNINIEYQKTNYDKDLNSDHK